jgi:hypothetical protein
MSIEIPSLNEVDPWKASSILPPGWHLCDVDSAEEGTSSGGHPQFEIRLMAIEGEHQGSTITDWLVITQGSLGRVKQVLDALGVPIPEGNFSVEARQLIAKRARVLVALEPKQDGSGTRSTVKGYQAVEGASASNGSQIGDPLPGEPEIPF